MAGPDGKGGPVPKRPALGGGDDSGARSSEHPARSPPRGGAAASRGARLGEAGASRGPRAEVFVGGLPGHWSEEDLAEALAAAGEVLSSRIAPSGGFGFVELSSLEAAERAVDDARARGGWTAPDGSVVRLGHAGRGREGAASSRGGDGQRGGRGRAGTEAEAITGIYSDHAPPERAAAPRASAATGIYVDGGGFEPGQGARPCGAGTAQAEAERQAADVAASLDPRELASVNLFRPPERNLVCYDDI